MAVVISRDFAEKFIERVTRHTHYNVNIMDERGVIIASRDADRVGQYHEIAYRLITGPEEMMDTSGAAWPNVRPGINMVIEVDRKREGVVGVTGNPDEIRPVALIVKMAIETMLKYEQQQEELRLRENRKEHFIYLLTQVEHSDPEQLRSMARDLDYPEEMIRIPILIRTADAGTALQVLRNSRLHTRKDFSFILDDTRLLVFKTLPEDRLFSDYREAVEEYLRDFRTWLAEEGREAAFYAGSFQDTYPQYYYAYRHCRWLEQTLGASRETAFFYDHAGEYLSAALPMGELQRVFHIYRSRIPPEKRRVLMEAAGALIRANYRFGAAAEQLFIHKNTLVYRYNKLKEFLDIDPLASAADRSFLECFYGYLARSGDFMGE